MALLVAACSGGGTGVPGRAGPAETGPRVESAATSGDADGLAGELLLAAAAAQPGPLRPAFVPGDADLAKELEALALDHLRSSGLGAGSGPDLVGSRRIQRLALDPNAPPDGNGNGVNWDETLAAEIARVAAFADAVPPVGTAMPLLPWIEGSADLAQPLEPPPDPAPASWRTRRQGADVVRLEHVGGAMRARVLAAQRLLARGRVSFAGSNSDEGLLGLLLVEQLLATEETLIGALFTSGGPLGELPDPGHYDPAAGRRWLPAEVSVALDPALAGAPLAFRVVDGASDLLGLATVLDAAAELAWFASDDNPSAAVREVFHGHPFAPPGPIDPPPPHVLNWQQDAGPLITFRCRGCHLGFPTGGFLIDTYQTVLAGSPRTRALGLPMVVPGNHAQSFLHRILVGPPPPFQRMPLGSSLPASEIQLVADWIDAGARENPPPPPVPPRTGEVLARILFRNLVAMHFDPVSGSLQHRHEGDGPSGVVTAAATGRALQALSRLAGALPDLEYQGLRPGDVLAQAARFAAEHLLDGNGRAVDTWNLATARAGAAAGLAGQAALAAGLLAARDRLPESHPGNAAAKDSAARLLADFRDPATGLFRSDPAHAFARYTPAVLADLLAALRGSASASIPGAGAALDGLLHRLRPLLTFAEWAGHGEVLDDGLPDTDGDGVPEPAAAGGAHGRLPLLAAAILVGDAADAPEPAAFAWSTHVRPLLVGTCGDCHFSGNLQGNYRLDTLRALGTPGQSGGVLPLLVPGDPERSFLYRKLVDPLPAFGEQMPLHRSPLDDKAREIVRLWILAGASGR